MRDMRKLIVFISSILIMSMLSGCSLFDSSVFLSRGCEAGDAFVIGEDHCKGKEARVYAASFADYYGKVGDTYIWDEKLDLNTSDVEESIKKGVLELLSRVYTLNVYAKDEGMELSETQLKAVEEATDEYFNNLDDTQKKDLKVSREDINDMYIRYAMALQVYGKIANEIDSDVSEDEARIMDAYIFESTQNDEVEKIKSRLETAKDFPMLVQTFSEGEKGLLHISRGTYPPEVEDKIFCIENEEIAGPIKVGDTVYYAYCKNKYNDVLSERNKNKIISSRNKKRIDEIEHNQNEEYYSELNQKFWDELEIKSEGQGHFGLFFPLIEKRFEVEL